METVQMFVSHMCMAYVYKVERKYNILRTKRVTVYLCINTSNQSTRQQEAYTESFIGTSQLRCLVNRQHIGVAVAMAGKLIPKSHFADKKILVVYTNINYNCLRYSQTKEAALVFSMKMCNCYWTW